MCVAFSVPQDTGRRDEDEEEFGSKAQQLRRAQRPTCLCSWQRHRALLQHVRPAYMAYKWHTFEHPFRHLKTLSLKFLAELCHVMPPVMATMSSAYQFVGRLPHLLSSAWW